MERSSKVRKKAVIYPFCAEVLPAIKFFNKLQKEYTIQYLVAPKGLGYTGRDAAYACNHPEIGMKVLDKMPLEEADWDTLFLFRPRREMGSLPWKNIVTQAISYKKHIIFLCSQEEELPEEIVCMESELADGMLEFRTLVDKNMLTSDEKTHEPDVPVLLVGGLLEEADCFEVFLGLAEKLRKEGQKVVAFSKHSIGSLFEFFGLDHIWNNSSYTEAEKVKQINYYVNDIAKYICADMILLEAPDAIMKYNDFVTNGYGIRTYMLCQAITPDYLICCVPFEMADNSMLEAMGRDFSYRFGCNIGAVHVSNILLDLADTMQREGIQILHTDMEFVHRQIEQQKNQRKTTVPMFNVVEEGIDGIYRILVDEK